MKTALYSIFTIAVALPMVASAATFSLVPNSGSFAPGETVSVLVYVNPGSGEEITTAKLSATFPANLVEVLSFTPAAGWIPLTTPDSDTVDNTNGKLVKTGGFPARVTSSGQFGTIALRTKAAGTATIRIEDDSMTLNTTNANTYTGATGATFTIAAPVIVPDPVVTTANNESGQTPPASAGTPDNESSAVLGESIEGAAEAEEEEAEGATSTQESAAQSALAAAAGAGGSGLWYYILAGIVLLLLLAVAWWKWGYTLRKSKN